MEHQFADECENPISCPICLSKSLKEPNRKPCKICKGKGLVFRYIDPFTNSVFANHCPACLGHTVELTDDEYDRIITARAKAMASLSNIHKV